MAVDPSEGGSGHRVRRPASGHHLAADGLSSTAELQTKHRGLAVPGSAVEEVRAIDADANFGMVTQLDQRGPGHLLPAAPAVILTCPARGQVNLSVHNGSLCTQQL
jgi:hypothetical protein